MRNCPSSKHLIDGTYELLRYFYTVPSAKDTCGQETGAVRGVLGSVLSMIEGGATHVGVATKDWRHWDPMVRRARPLAESLFAAWEDALLFRTLATLRVDVPVFTICSFRSLPLTDGKDFHPGVLIRTADQQNNKQLVRLNAARLGQRIPGDRILEKNGFTISEARFDFLPPVDPVWSKSSSRSPVRFGPNSNL